MHFLPGLSEVPWYEGTVITVSGNSSQAPSPLRSFRKNRSWLTGAGQNPDLVHTGLLVFGQLGSGPCILNDANNVKAIIRLSDVVV